MTLRLGGPGVDVHLKHEGEGAVIQIEFLVNEGALITATSDDVLHLWNFRQKKPEVVYSLKFQRERYECNLNVIVCVNYFNNIILKKRLL